MIEENFMVGKKFPYIRIHMTHAFGFSEQEYVISFETDEPRDFVAFKAAIELLKEKHQEHVITETYQKWKEELLKPISEMRTVVKDIYKFLNKSKLVERKSLQILLLPRAGFHLKLSNFQVQHQKKKFIWNESVFAI